MTQNHEDTARKRRQRNYMLAAALLALVTLFYLLTMVRLGSAT